MNEYQPNVFRMSSSRSIAGVGGGILLDLALVLLTGLDLGTVRRCTRVPTCPEPSDVAKTEESDEA
jgi:hypothetical protein